MNRRFLIGLLCCLALLIAASSVYAADNSSWRDRIVDLNLKDVPVNEALANLFRGTGLNFVLDQRLHDIRVTVQLKSVRFEDALNVLTSSAGAMYQVDESETTITITGLPKSAVPPVTDTIKLSYIKADDISPLIKRISGISEVTVTNSNMLLIKGTKAAVDEAQNVVQKMDVPGALPKQLSIEIEITIKQSESENEIIGTQTVACVEGLRVDLNNSTVIPRKTTITAGGKTVSQMSQDSLTFHVSLIPTLTGSPDAKNNLTISLKCVGQFQGSVNMATMYQVLDTNTAVIPDTPTTILSGTTKSDSGKSVDYEVIVTAKIMNPVTTKK